MCLITRIRYVSELILHGQFDIAIYPQLDLKLEFIVQNVLRVGCDRLFGKTESRKNKHDGRIFLDSILIEIRYVFHFPFEYAVDFHAYFLMRIS